jgi:ABC-type branched-subunit amino acid transport system ATPase component
MTRLRDLGHAVVVVEQNLPLALSVADVVYIIAAGRFVFHGTPGELRNRTDILNEHLGVSGSKSI